jgi:hypothetical protein
MTRHFSASIRKSADDFWLRYGKQYLSLRGQVSPGVRWLALPFMGDSGKKRGLPEVFFWRSA